MYIALHEDLDQGEPAVISKTTSHLSQIYRQLAADIAAEMYWQGEVIPMEIACRTL